MNTLADKLPKGLQPGPAALAQLQLRLPVVVTVLLVLACSYSLAQLTWLLLPEEAESQPGRQALTPPARSIQSQQNDYSHISNAHLFGRYQQTETAPVTTDAPETRLNLVLRGILSATPAEMASAIISIGKGGKEDTYSVGDKVSSATIREIHADRVILSRGGRLETLRMPKDFSNQLIRSAPATSGSRTSESSSIDTSSPGKALADIRKQIIKNPTSFSQFAIPQPYKENGKLKGYRLKPKGDRSLFDSVGLQPDDIVIAVNGIELNNPSRGLKAIRKLQNAKQVDIVVLRQGAEVPLHFELP